jgi:hypothetical protein
MSEATGTKSLESEFLEWIIEISQESIDEKLEKSGNADIIDILRQCRKKKSPRKLEYPIKVWDAIDIIRFGDGTKKRRSGERSIRDVLQGRARDQSLNFESNTVRSQSFESMPPPQDQKTEVNEETKRVEAKVIEVIQSIFDVDPDARSFFQVSEMYAALTLALNELVMGKNRGPRMMGTGDWSAVDYIFKQAEKLHKEQKKGKKPASQKNFLAWTVLPTSLFGTHLSKLTGSSAKTAEY